MFFPFNKKIGSRQTPHGSNENDGTDLSVPRQRGRPRKNPIDKATATAAATAPIRLPKHPPSFVGGLPSNIPAGIDIEMTAASATATAPAPATAPARLPSTLTDATASQISVNSRIRIPEHQAIYDRLFGFIVHSAVPNILLYGEAGCGKKTIVSWFLNTIYNNDTAAIVDDISKVEPRKLDASKVLIADCIINNGIDFVRNDIQFFSKANTIHESKRAGQFKTVVMYNAEHLTADAQTALRRSIEIFSSTTRFIMVVRNPEKLIAPILSRFCDIYVPLPTFNGERMSFYRMKKERRAIIPREIETERRRELLEIIERFNDEIESKKKQAEEGTKVVKVKRPRGRPKKAEGGGSEHELPAASPPPLQSPTSDNVSCLVYASRLYELGYSASDVIQLIDHFITDEDKSAQLRLKYDILRCHIYNERAHIAFLLYYILMRNE